MKVRDMGIKIGETIIPVSHISCLVLTGLQAEIEYVNCSLGEGITERRNIKCATNKIEFVCVRGDKV